MGNLFLLGFFFIVIIIIILNKYGIIVCNSSTTISSSSNSSVCIGNGNTNIHNSITMNGVRIEEVDDKIFINNEYFMDLEGSLNVSQLNGIVVVNGKRYIPKK